MSIDNLIQRAGTIVGTDPSLRNIGCIAAALDMLERKLNSEPSDQSLHAAAQIYSAFLAMDGKREITLSMLGPLMRSVALLNQALEAKDVE